jgi:hypothetical protein
MRKGERVPSSRFREVFDALPEEVKDSIRAKAQWEQMSLSAVTRDWWPDIWKRVGY